MWAAEIALPFITVWVMQLDKEEEKKKVEADEEKLEGE